MIRAVIVEDEPLARGSLRDFLAGLSWIECVGEATDGHEAVALINREEPDLVFLDIELPGKSGLEVLECVTYQPAVIFTTAYDRFALDAFELHAVDYLLKPFGRDRFLKAIERARFLLHADDGDVPVRQRLAMALSSSAPIARIFIRDQGKIVPILTRDVTRLEANDDYVTVHSNGKRYLVYLPLAEFERRLDPAQFLRIHRSHIVNADFVLHLEAYDSGRLLVTMRDGTKLMASRIRSRELRHLAL